MKISENTRQSKAGKQQAEALIETIHSFYLNDNTLEYLQALIKRLTQEFDRRKAASRNFKKEN